MPNLCITHNRAILNAFKGSDLDTFVLGPTFATNGVLKNTYAIALTHLICNTIRPILM